jgi:hypothetical protein
MTRFREQVIFSPVGESIVRGGYHHGGSYVSERHAVTDTPDIPGDGWGFDVLHEEWLGGKMYWPNDGWWWYDGTVVDAVKGHSGYLGQGLDLPDSPSDGAVATQVMAATNPSRPVVDLPIAVAELKDLPQLIHDSGKRFLQRAAGANLKYQFGIAPLASDLAKLTTFQSFVSKRVERLTKLRDKGLRSTLPIGSYSNQKQEWVSLNSFGVGWSEIINFTTTQKVWGHIRWFPQENHRMPTTDEEMRRLAINATLGLTFDASTAWNLIPWSWLVDWFSNVGDYFTAHRNIVPASCSPVQVMRETKVSNFGPSYVDSWGQLYTGVHYKRTMKSRRLSNASLSAHLPFLSGRQLSILGSLAVLRR